ISVIAIQNCSATVLMQPIDTTGMRRFPPSIQSVPLGESFSGCAQQNRLCVGIIVGSRYYINFPLWHILIVGAVAFTITVGSLEEHLRDWHEVSKKELLSRNNPRCPDYGRFLARHGVR